MLQQETTTQHIAPTTELKTFYGVKIKHSLFHPWNIGIFEKTQYITTVSYDHNDMIPVAMQSINDLLPKFPEGIIASDDNTHMLLDNKGRCVVSVEIYEETIDDMVIH